MKVSRFEIIFYLASLLIIMAGCRVVKQKYTAIQQRNQQRRDETAPKLTKVQAYVKRFLPVALAEQQRFGIPASITLAQGILESGVGRSKLAADYNNHFGIKCWCKGKRRDCVPMADDRPNDRFRKYKTAWESYRDHSRLLQTDTYRHLRGTDYKRFAKGLKRAGYATKNTYANDLIAVVERYNLNKFDN